MQYDFSKKVDRRNTGAMKWDCESNELPMWVADMDFETAPQVLEAMQKRLDHGVFGYTLVVDEWYDAYIYWWEKRHHHILKKEWLMFCTGIVPAISSMVRKLTTPNENVLVLSPVYNIFYNSIINNGCRALECALVYENGEYEIDFADLERKLSDPQTSLMIFCNPHNPVGKIWDKETLIKIGDLCEKYAVTVISDEIHCDILRPGQSYVPFASASKTCEKVSITCMSPTKTFNIAGLQTACISVPDQFLRHKVWRGINTDEVAEPNVFAITAAIAAFTKGEAWVDELTKYLFDNRAYAEEFIAKNIPEVTLVKADATYLLWIDIRNVFKDGIEAAAFIRKETGLYISDGNEYGKTGEHFIRVNIACPRQTVIDGLNRLQKAVQKKCKNL